MKTKKKSLDEKEKAAKKEAITAKLREHPEVLFAYLHGSFLTQEFFNDIDLALYLTKLPDSVLDYELNMEVTLGNAAAGTLVDVRVLNAAPLSFQYNVIKEGKPIVVRDENERVEFQERTIKYYFDFAPFRKRYLQEVFRIAL